VAVEEPGNPAVAQALQRVWPRLTTTVLATNNQIMSLVFEENLATELLEEEDSLCLSGRKLRRFSNTGSP